MSQLVPFGVAGIALFRSAVSLCSPPVTWMAKRTSDNLEAQGFGHSLGFGGEGPERKDWVLNHDDNKRRGLAHSDSIVSSASGDSREEDSVTADRSHRHQTKQGVKT
jgi:hypothetical protein